MAAKNSIFENVVDCHAAIDYCFKLAYSANSLRPDNDNENITQAQLINLESMSIEAQNILRGFPDFYGFVKYFLTLGEMNRQFINDLQIFFPDIFEVNSEELLNFQDTDENMNEIIEIDENQENENYFQTENIDFFDDITIPTHADITNLPEFDTLPTLLRETIPNLNPTNTYELRSKGVELLLGIICSEVFFILYRLCVMRF